MLLTCAIYWIKPFLRKIISLHFNGLQIMLFSSDLIKIWSTTSVRQRPLLQTGTMRVESSAYLNRAWWLSMLICRSLIKIVNKYGPLTLPYVVPLFTNSHSPWKLFYIMHCWRFSRKLKYQLIMNGVNGISLSLQDKSSWLTLSNALLKSMANKRTALHLGSSR